MSEIVINPDLNLSIIETYDVIDIINNGIVKSFDTKEEAEDFVEKSSNPLLFDIEFSSNRKLIEELDRKYSGCELYSVYFEDNEIKVDSVNKFDAHNIINLTFISKNGDFANIIAHNEDEAIELAKNYFEKLNNKEPIDIAIRDF